LVRRLLNLFQVTSLEIAKKIQLFKETQVMLSNCRRCGSSLTVKEAIQNWCSSCNRSTSEMTSIRFNGNVQLGQIRRDFDLLVAGELGKGGVTSAAKPRRLRAV
jgi:hypothetical protein